MENSDSSHTQQKHTITFRPPDPESSKGKAIHIALSVLFIALSITFVSPITDIFIIGVGGDVNLGVSITKVIQVG